MLDSYPPNIQTFVDQKIAAGVFSSVDDFSIEAAELYLEMDRRREALKAKLANATAELERGEGIVLNGPEEIREFFAEIRAEGRHRLAAEVSKP
jgi:Arc/MetJ-type ribon-helix-helix transcriptional regulator